MVKQSSEEQRVSKKKDKKQSRQTHASKTKTKEAPRPKPAPHGKLDLDDARARTCAVCGPTLEEAAAAAAASTEPSPPSMRVKKRSNLPSACRLRSRMPHSKAKAPSAPKICALSYLPIGSQHHARLSHEWHRHVRPAQARKASHTANVEGTLYDKTGPYVKVPSRTVSACDSLVLNGATDEFV